MGRGSGRRGVVRKRPVLASGSVVRIAVVSAIITGPTDKPSRTEHPRWERGNHGEGERRTGRSSSPPFRVSPSPTLLYGTFRSKSAESVPPAGTSYSSFV